MDLWFERGQRAPAKPSPAALRLCGRGHQGGKQEHGERDGEEVLYREMDFLMMAQVRTLLVYGYVLDPPTGDVEQAEVAVSRHPTHRTYRAENTYGVSSGKWFV